MTQKCTTCIFQSSRKTALCAFAKKGCAAHHAYMNLKRIRRLRGLTQEQLADMVGVNQSTILRAEKVDESAKLSTYQACADALGIPLVDLFTDPRSAEEAELIRAFRNIPADRHAQLLGLIRLAESQPLASPQSEK